MQSNFDRQKLWLLNNKLPLIIVCIFLTLTLFLSYELNIWQDEYCSLTTTSKDIEYAFSNALYFENQPPLYFVLLNIWMILGHTPFIARLLSIIFILLSFWVIKNIVKEVEPDINPVWILPIFAFNPFIVWTAVEIRVYALVVLLSSLLLYNFYCGYLSDNPSRKNRVFYIFLSIISLYTQYYMGFLLAANGMVLIIYKRWKNMKQYIINMILPFISILFLIPVIPDQLHSTIEGSLARDKIFHLSFLERILFIIRRLSYYIIPQDFRLINYKLILIFLCVLFILLNRHYIQRFVAFLYSRNSFTLMIVALLSIIYFSLVNFVGGPEHLQDRHTASLFVPLILSIFFTISYTGNKKNMAIWTAIFLIIYGLNLFEFYSPLAKRGDSKHIAEFIMKNEGNDQPVITEYKYLNPLIKYYYNGPNNISFLFEYDTLKDDDSLKTFYNSVINKWMNNDRLWYISDNNEYDKYLRQKINDEFKILKEKKFFGNKLVFLLKKKNI